MGFPSALSFPLGRFASGLSGIRIDLAGVGAVWVLAAAILKLVTVFHPIPGRGPSSRAVLLLAFSLALLGWSSRVGATSSTAQDLSLDLAAILLLPASFEQPLH